MTTKKNLLILTIFIIIISTLITYSIILDTRYSGEYELIKSENDYYLQSVIDQGYELRCRFSIKKYSWIPFLFKLSVGGFCNSFDEKCLILPGGYIHYVSNSIKMNCIGCPDYPAGMHATGCLEKYHLVAYSCNRISLRYKNVIIYNKKNLLEYSRYKYQK